MSDSRFALQNGCGCCEGLGSRAPVVISNRPGLTAVTYRIGNHSDILATMLARLSSKDNPALARLRTRESDDFTIALLDGYSCIADVLTFYQERIVNESYLRTAEEQFSLRGMARLVGYRLNPGVAAETYLAFSMEQTAGAPKRVTLATGLKVQSVPAQDEKPQTFETVEKIEARQEWDEIRCQTAIPWEPVLGDRNLYLQGISHNIQPGDVILIVGNHRCKNPGSERWDARLVERVEMDSTNNRTRITWERGLGHTSPYTEPAVTDVDVYVFRQQASLFGNNAPDPHMLDSISPGLKSKITNYRWNDFIIQNYQIDLDGPHKKVVPQSWILLVSNQDFKSNDALPGYIELYRAKSVYIMSRSDFGLSTRITRIEPDTHEHLDSRYDLRKTLVYCQSELLPTSDRPLNYPVYGDTLALDGEIEGLTPQKALAISGKRPRISIADDNLSLKLDSGSTRLLNRGDTLQLIGVPGRLIGSVLQPLSPVEFGKALKKVVGDNLRLLLLDRDGSTGTLDVRSDQILLQPAQDNDSVSAEIIFIADLPTAVKSSRDTTLVELSKGLSEIYDRSSVRVNGNVVLATHGETVHQLLGSGQARRSHQHFELKHSPLTFVSATNETGAESALEVRVNDIGWHEIDTLYNAAPDDRSYVLRTGENGDGEIRFGDGLRGARLPTGQENIYAVYRKGIGTVGNLKSNQLSQLLSRPLGLKSVINPQSASGGVDAEKQEDARRNIPLGVRTLGRAVSLQDYEDYACAYTGIAKAHAQVLHISGIRTIFITVAGKDGLQPQAGGPLLTRLIGSLKKNSDPFLACDVAAYVPAYFKIALKIRRHPDHDIDTVLKDVDATLRQTFSFAGSSFGQLVARSRIIDAAQRVKGVIGVDVKRFYRGSSIYLHDRLAPKGPFEVSHGVTVGAELLFLDPAPFDFLKEML